MPGILEDFPQIRHGGSVPLTELDIKPRFTSLIEELKGPEFEQAVSEKFNVDLSDRPTMFTVRGNCRAKDGKIHADSKTKIITILIYFNPDWTDPNGQLRLLRSKDNLDDYVAEVPPEAGTMIIFRRCDHSWHGHTSYEGPRRAIQMNWVLDEGVVRHEQGRHRWSSWMKKIGLAR